MKDLIKKIYGKNTKKLYELGSILSAATSRIKSTKESFDNADEFDDPAKKLAYMWSKNSIPGLGLIGDAMLKNEQQEDTLNAQYNTMYELGGGINDPSLEAMSKVITNRNKNKQWVDRVLNPDKYAKPLKDSNNKDVTHKLAYTGIENDKHLVYPTVRQVGDNLQQYDNKGALNEVYNKKDGIVIPNKKLADYYSKQGLIKHELGGALKGISSDDFKAFNGNNHAQGGLDINTEGVPSKDEAHEVEKDESAVTFTNMNGEQLSYVFSKRLKI